MQSSTNTRAMPDEIQGCALIGGYFGAVVELHRLHDEGSGFKSTQLPKLVKSSNAAGLRFLGDRLGESFS